MAISYLTEETPLAVSDHNSVFDAMDEALSILFNGQSPFLYLPKSGGGSVEEAGLCGVFVVFGTKANRKIFSAVDSHDQAAIDSAVAAESLGTADHTLKQVTLGLAAGYLENSLVTQKRSVTPPSGPAEDYWVRVEATTGVFQHEHPHELAALDVVFEGHADRTFEWPVEWDKFRCIRFHNLDSDATPLVITMEETAEEITLNRWECVAVRRNAAGTSWVEEGFVLWRMRDEDLVRFGGTIPWNDKRRATLGADLTVWESDGANNVASLALVHWLCDYFSTAITPPSVHTQCGDGLGGSFDERTGFWFDLSNFTRNAGTLAPFPDPTADTTPLYQLAWHGGQMLVFTKNLDASTVFASGSPTIAQLLSGDAATGLTLEIDSGGNSAHLVLTTETGKDYADVMPVGSNLGASGHPFTVDANGVGYSVPAAMDGTWSGIKRLANDTERSETVVGIGTSVTTDYQPLKAENASDGSLEWPPFDTTAGDVEGWAFADATKNNDHGTFMTNSPKWDGRAYVVNVELECAPVDGCFPNEDVAASFSGCSLATLQECVVAEYSKVNWFQASVIQEWPPAPHGGAWLTPNYSRRSREPLDSVTPIANPHLSQYLGNAAGDDWTARQTLTYPASRGIKRQLPVDASSGDPYVVSPYLGPAYMQAQDSSQLIVGSFATSGWWETNRTDAIAGNAIGSEVRPVIAIPTMARHFNAFAQRLNSLMRIVPFSFFDAQYYGTLFRPDYSDGGIFGGHVYPYGFICYSTGSVATRATDLGLTVRDFQTEFSGYSGYADMDIDGRYGSGSTGPAFDASNGTGWNAWNKDLPRWFYPAASLARNESAQIDDTSPGTGWVQGELAYSTVGPAVDWYWWQYDNDSSFDFPDFDYIRADDVATLADDLGIPFRLVRLFASWEPYQFIPDRVGLGCKVCPVAGGGSATREEVRLVPAIISESFVCFAGTDERWAAHGLVRVSDWPACPATQGTDDATAQQSNADPMHGLNRSGSGDVIEYPYGFTPASGTPDTTWENGDPFEGEARHLSFESYDTAPTPPSGWTGPIHRLASYPVPITEWGASEIETHAAPACDAKFVRLSDLSQKFDAADLWSQNGGSGAWGGEGAFAVHLMPGGITKT